MEIHHEFWQAYVHDSWRLGYFNPNFLKSCVEVNTYCKELEKRETLHLDSMSTFSFMKPGLFDSLKKYHKKLTKPEKVNTGTGFFMVQTYIELKFKNLSGDYVPIRFFSSPGLKEDGKVSYLVGLGPAIRLGFDMGKVNQNIVIRNELSEYESLNDEEFETYNLFRNMEESADLYKGKSRTDINYEYMSLLVNHVEDEDARNILLKKLYKYPLVVGTRDKYNISFFNGFEFKAKIKPGAKWRKMSAKRLPKTQELQVEEDLRKYEDAGFIERAKDISTHVANILVVQKKPPKNPPYDWKPEFRLCVNFTEFNKNTEDIVEQIPDQVELIRSVGKKKYFISVDVRQAFHHLLVAECMKTYLRMIDHRGIIWVWIRTPYGLKQIPSLFNLILMTSLPKPWVSYFDDIVCSVDTLEEFDDAIEELFKWCYSMNVTLHIPKSDWYVKELDILGYKISQNAILPNNKAVKNVLSLTKPENKNQLQALLGVINYIRKFIPNLARYLVPMNKLLRKTASIEFKTDKPRIIDENRIHGGKIYHADDYKVIYKKHDGKSNIFNENLAYVFTKGTIKGKKVKHSDAALTLSSWDKECDEALARIQEICQKLPMLVPPNFDKQFILYTDSDEEAIGGTLMQEHEGVYLPVEFGSMGLSKKHHDYWNISEKEIFAIVYFMDKWKKYFNHRLDTIVYCDNQSVCTLLNNDKMTSKLLRWKGQLLRYNAEFRGITSGNNAMADFLSRVRNQLVDAKSNQPRSSNGKPFLEYLDDPKKKPIKLTDLEPMKEEETTKYKYLQKLKSDKKPDYYNPNFKPNNKCKLSDTIIFNRVPEGVVRPFCPHCSVTMAYSTPNKYYNIENTVCQDCKTKLEKHRNMWVCTKPTKNHKDYHICNKCASKRPYDENMAKLYYMSSEKEKVNYCYVHLNYDDCLHKRCRDPNYEISLKCPECENELLPFRKKIIYGDSITKCDECPFRIPSNHIMYHCFNEKHQNGLDICVPCAFQLANIDLPKDDIHHPNVTPRFPYKLSIRNSDEADNFQLPKEISEEDYSKELSKLKSEMNVLKEQITQSHNNSHKVKQPTDSKPIPTNKPISTRKPKNKWKEELSDDNNEEEKESDDELLVDELLKDIDQIQEEKESDDECEEELEELEDIVNYVKIKESDFKNLRDRFLEQQKRKDLETILNGKEFSDLQKEDPDLNTIYNWLKNDNRRGIIPEKVVWDLNYDRYKLINDTIYYSKQPDADNVQWRLVIPKVARAPLLHAVHNSLLHPGITNLTTEIKKRYYWYKYTDQIRNFVSHCRICQDSKAKSATQHRAKFEKWRPSAINEVIAIDFTKPSMVESKSGHQRVLTIVDLYDGWLTYVPTRGETADDWILALEKYFWRNGTPETIICDNGSSFTGLASKRFKKLLGLNIRYISAFNPQSNGTAERANRFLKDSLSTIGVHLHINAPEKELDWEHYLDYIAFIHNCCTYPPTGLAPWTIRNGSVVPDVTKLNWNTYGDLISGLSGATQSKYQAVRKAKLNKLIRREVRKNTKHHINKQYRKYLKLSRNKPYHGIKIGDKIDIKESRFVGKSNNGRTNKAKIRLNWRGPYTVLAINSSGTSFEVARLEDETKTPTFWTNLRLVRKTTCTEERTHDNHMKNLKKLKRDGYVPNTDLKPIKRKEKEN